MTEEPDALEDAEMQQEGTSFLPMVIGETRKFYLIKVEDLRIKGGILFHKEFKKVSEMSQPQLALDLVTLQSHPSDRQPQPSLKDVAQQLHPPLNDVAQQLHPLSDDVAQQPLLSVEAFTGKKKPKKTLILLADYIRFTKDDKKRSRYAFYRDLHLGKLGLPVKVVCKRKKKYYFIEIEDPKVIERASFHGAIKKMLKMKEKTINIHLRVPEEISKVINMISSPASSDYGRFYEFVDQRPTEVLPIRIDFNPVTYLGRRINIQKKHYQKVLWIAEANDLSVSKVIVTLLKSHLAVEHKIYL
jgi:hypothetical protein